MTYEDFLLHAATADSRIMVLTAENRAAIRTLPSRLGSRFVDVGIAEQTLLGAAAGLALRGRIPVVHALAAFLTMRGFEFARTDIGLPQLPVKLIGAVAGFLSEANGPTHQAIEDIALMRAIPSMRIFCPADLGELLSGMAVILPDPSPWYVRYCARPVRVAHTAPVTIGRAEQLTDGSDLTVLTYGFLVGECLDAVMLLRSRGIVARLLNMRTLEPVDRDAIVAAASDTGHLVVVEDHFATGGLATIVAEQLVASGVRATCQALSLGRRWFTPAMLPDVLEREGFTAPQLAQQIAASLSGRSRRLHVSV